VCRDQLASFLLQSNRMVHFVRTIILFLSVAGLSLAGPSWSFSDATIAVGPKNKDATALHTYPQVLAMVN